MCAEDGHAHSFATLGYIYREFAICGLPDHKEFVLRLLLSGKCAILFDGLDEVASAVRDSVLRDLNKFADTYGENQIIISCRVAAYNYWFERFVDVEVADFGDHEIQAFIQNWFGDDSKKAQLCWAEMNRTTGIKEIACTPLLLTMICLAYDETMEFGKNGAELYRDAIEALLRKWDTSRTISRGEIYQHLTTKRKEAMFCTMAAHTFESEQYFFQKSTAVELIRKFLTSLGDSTMECDPDGARAVLEACEAQHSLVVERAKGIYSFSHLTFHEYFTALYVVSVGQDSWSNLIRSYVGDVHGRKYSSLSRIYYRMPINSLWRI